MKSRILLAVLSHSALWVVSPLRAEERRPLDREISDEQVLRAIGSGFPALRAQDLAQAHRLLARHFAEREKPTVPETEFPGIGRGDSTITLKATGAQKQIADEKWMRHVFVLRDNDRGTSEEHSLGTPIQWLKSPMECSSGMAYINQLNILAKLAGVYRDTGEDKYAVEVGKMMVSWVRECPLRFSGHITKGEVTNINTYMQVRNRLCNCLAAYDAVRKCAAVTPEIHMAFWKLFLGNSRYLVEWSSGRGVVTYPGLIASAVLLPELRESREWLEAGVTNLRENLVDRTTPDGAWDTHSISYQTVPVPWAQRCLELIRASGREGELSEIAEMIEGQTRKMQTIMMWLAMPNGGTPNIGDSYGRADWSSAYVNARTSQYLATIAANDREKLGSAEDPFDRLRAALAYVEGTSSPEPAATSIGFPATGYYVMRSNWEPTDARYLYFDLSPQARGHCHRDACHFDLYAYGKPLITDTGDYFLGWGARTALHNTIEVDGQHQAWRAEMTPYEWVTAPGFDFIDAAHASYEELGVIHRRKVFFVKPDYWILCDLLTGDRGKTHRYEQFFHFAGPVQSRPADVALDPKTCAARTQHPGVANVQVIPAHVAGLRASLVEGQDTDMSVKDKSKRKAMLGWMVTAGCFKRVKSPVAVYTREGKPPQAFYDVLFPTARGWEVTVTVEELPVRERGAAVSPNDAAGLAIRCVVGKPAHSPEAIKMDLGPNLARGARGFAEINSGSISQTGAAVLNDGDPAPRRISGAISSSPYQPKVALNGRFGMDFGKPVKVNHVVLHHGTWNGHTILYSPEKLAMQYWDGKQWRDVANARTTWQGENVSHVSFDSVRTARLSARVERPSGGRLAMREFEAYCVSEDERRRVEALRRARVTEEWTDYFLISHTGARKRTYGDFAFDGEIALVRRSVDGQIARVLTKRAAFDSGGTLDALSATWQDGPPTRPSPRIRDLRVELHPPQKGLAGGQPWAVVTWQTDRPATSQVEFGSDGELDRRTPASRERVTAHRVTVDFLRKQRKYAFRAVSVCQHGLRAESEWMSRRMKGNP